MDGNGDGTSPDKSTTLTGALAILETVDRDGMIGNIEVILAEGYYYQSETIKLNEKHGGNGLYTVVFKADDGAEVTIGGGMKLNGSAFRDDDGDGIYVADVPAGTRTRQLYIDNVRAVRARSEGTLKNAEFLYEGDAKIGLVCDNVELLDSEKFGNPDGLELIYHEAWQHARVGVSMIQEADDGRVKLIMDQPAWEKAFLLNNNQIGFKIEHLDYYENALGLLDTAGEWYLDESANKLYYMPRKWEDMANVTVVIPTLDAWDQQGTSEGGLLTVMGSDYDNMAQNIRFEDITFADVTWMRPSSEYGHNANQNNHIIPDGLMGAYDITADAAITVKRANSVSFSNCEFTRIGTIALKMTAGVQNSFITGNHFYDISGNAIQIGEPNYRVEDNVNPSDIRKMMKNCDVMNNYIHDTGVDFKSAAAIGVGFAANMDLSHNEIFHIPYSGFHIGYGWGATFDSVHKNMKISHNFIHDHMHEEMNDGGGIYVISDTAGNNVISENYIRNQGSHQAAMYFDNGSTHWSAERNVIDISENLYDEKVNQAIKWAYVNTYAKNIQVKNNYANGIYRVSDDPTVKDVVVENNTNVDGLNWPQEALGIMANSGLQTTYEGLRNNQAERICVNVGEEEKIILGSNETFQINVTATDGKDNPVTLGETVYYDIVDKEVATVSDTGLITAQGDGITVLRIYVVSNGILDIVEREVYVDDTLEKILLKNISGDISLYLISGTKTQLKPYGLTERARELEVTDVVYETSDDAIAVVNENGMLMPVAVGETTLTVTGTAEGQTISTNYNVIVKAIGEVSYMDEIFEAENQSYWVGTDLSSDPACSWSNEDGVSLNAELNGWRNYTGRKYDDELLTFYMSIDPVKTWPSIYLRLQENNSAVGCGGTGYIICFTDLGMQLQRFNGNKRTVIYGIIAGHTYEPLVGPNVTPYPLEDKQLHKIQVAAINEGDGVRLLMYIDGEEIFNYHDTAADAIREAGYFGLIGTGSNGEADKFMLKKASAVEDAAGDVTGDVTGDGKLTNADITRLRAAFAGKVELDETAQKAADVNGDGKLTNADITRLRAGYAGKISLSQ